MGYDLTSLNEAGIDTKTGLQYTGREDKYIAALQRFYKNHDKNRTKIDKCLAENDYENYMITVHSLKSNSRMIGALSLGDGFEELELAAKNDDHNIVLDKTPSVLNEYDSITDSLKEIGEMEEVRPAGELSPEKARETAEKLLAALDDFDDELSKELVEKLGGYPFRITQRTKLEEAADNIEKYLYDEAASLIREIAGDIE